MAKKNTSEQSDHDLLIELRANIEALLNQGQETLSEVKLTNGRVNKLEKWQEGHKEHHVSSAKIIGDLTTDVSNVMTYQNKQKGAWAAILIAGSIVGTIIGFVIGMIFF